MATFKHWRRYLNHHFLTDSIVKQVLCLTEIEKLCRQTNYHWRKTFWSPTTTLITFILQVLSAEKSLRAAVASLLTHLSARGETEFPSADPTAYCQARKRLPGNVVTGMMNVLVERIRGMAGRDNTWLGHRVFVIDGSKVSMPDTPELQAAYPQPSGQKKGCGFPVARLGVLFCWTTGAVVDFITDTLWSHELPLFRKLWHNFSAGDVILADRAYCSFVDIARLVQQSIHGVFRQHQRRKSDFRTGRRLGHDDQLVIWERPLQWLVSCGISKDEFLLLPETLTLRQIRITQTPKGFRSRTIIVVTTLLDPIETPADEIRALYRDRWTAELNLRSLKIYLGMDILRGQSVDIIHKEIVMHMMAYNLIRLIMWHAARQHGQDLHRLSFTGTLHRLRRFMFLMLFINGMGKQNRDRLIDQLLEWIASDIVPKRPNRLEPRRRKRRPKLYSLLNKPRYWYKTHKDVGAR